MINGGKKREEEKEELRNAWIGRTFRKITRNKNKVYINTCLNVFFIL